MPLSEQRGEGVAIGVDLVNSWDELHDEPDILSERWLRRWLAWHRMYDAAEHVSEGDLARARSCASGWRARSTRRARTRRSRR